MPYTITREIQERAQQLGITVKPSKNPNKKLDAYVGGVFQNSFGAAGYADYHIYKRQEGEKVANEKRKQYKARHAKDRTVKYRDGKLTAGWLSWYVLWN